MANGYILSKGAVNSLDSYRKLEKLLTSKEIKQIQDETHDKIMRLIDENYQMKIINLKFI